MNTPSLMLAEPPELSDQAAGEMLDFLYQLITAFENHYASQLRRYHQPTVPQQPDPCENFDDDLPTF